MPSSFHGLTRIYNGTRLSLVNGDYLLLLSMLMNIVFLRVLEYYIGIIFLTTNRVGNIDEAFNSRIHISLYYPPLNHGQTLGIWRMNLDRLSQIEDERSQVTGERRLTIARDEILKFAEDLFIIDDMRWNGRQIRNAFLIASALARFDKHAEEDTISE